MLIHLCFSKNYFKTSQLATQVWSVFGGMNYFCQGTGWSRRGLVSIDKSNFLKPAYHCHFDSRGYMSVNRACPGLWAYDLCSLGVLSERFHTWFILCYCHIKFLLLFQLATQALQIRQLVMVFDMKQSGSNEVHCGKIHCYTCT